MTRGRYPKRDPDNSYIIDELTGCWNWQGPKSSRGQYAIYIIAQGTGWSKHVKAHIWFWEREFGPIEEGYELHHTCFNKLCVNPAHLTKILSQDHRILHRANKAGVKLSVEAAADIRVRHSLGISIPALARFYDVSPYTIRDVLDSTTWKTE